MSGLPCGFDMMQPLPPSREMPLVLPATRPGSAMIGIVAGLIGAGLLVGSLALWATYGTTLFFETIASGLKACL